MDLTPVTPIFSVLLFFSVPFDLLGLFYQSLRGFISSPSLVLSFIILTAGEDTPEGWLDFGRLEDIDYTRELITCYVFN